MSDDGLVLRRYATEDGALVAVCDSCLRGQRFEEDGVHLDLSSEFYDGSPASTEEVGEALRDAAVANVVGERAVDVAVEVDAVDPDLVIEVEGVPHGQMVRL